MSIEKARPMNAKGGGDVRRNTSPMCQVSIFSLEVTFSIEGGVLQAQPRPHKTGSPLIAENELGHVILLHWQ